jgi:hypothetical protein
MTWRELSGHAQQAGQQADAQAPQQPQQPRGAGGAHGDLLPGGPLAALQQAVPHSMDPACYHSPLWQQLRTAAAGEELFFNGFHGQLRRAAPPHVPALPGAPLQQGLAAAALPPAARAGAAALRAGAPGAGAASAVKSRAPVGPALQAASWRTRWAWARRWR